MNRPIKVSVNRIEPQTIKLKIFAMTTIEVPVKVRTQNKLPDGLQLLSITADPAKVKIMVPRHKKAEYGPIMTEPVNLDEISQSASKYLKLALPEKAHLQESDLSMVKVKIEIAPVSETRKRTR
jgi:YbbR domain-containing protein